MWEGKLMLDVELIIGVGCFFLGGFLFLVGFLFGLMIMLEVGL